MFLQNFLKLRPAVHELLCEQTTKKLRDDAENNTANSKKLSKRLYFDEFI